MSLDAPFGRHRPSVVVALRHSLRATVCAPAYCGLRCSRGLPLASRSTVMSKCLPRKVTFVIVSDFHLDGNTGGYAWTRPGGSMRKPVSPYTRPCTNPAEPLRKSPGLLSAVSVRPLHGAL